MTALITCQVCGKKFQPWRKKEFCSERCRKRAENRRLRGAGANIPDSQNSQKNDEQNQDVGNRQRGDESPAFKVARAEWVFSNEITGKLDYQGKPLGWVMYSDRPKRWFGRVRDERGQWSFQAESRERALKAVEAWIRYEPIERRESERMWAGDCWEII